MIIYGKNIVKEAVHVKRPIFNLYLDEKFNDRDFINFLEKNKVKFSFKDKGELNNLTNNGVHQGVVAEILAYKTKELEDVIVEGKRQRFLILDELEDPHNLGAILRTAEATKLDAIIMSRRNQVPLNATVAKVSAGAIEHVDVVTVSNINQAIQTLKNNGIWIIGTAGEATTEYTDIPKDLSVAIILGNEGQGIRPLVKKNCDILVKIPMYGKVNSLNVSVAAALMLYASL
ncbi:MAG TPA: 23S rRNA (guanosine(2251)-2'-O)-methyltransferase RlmB [Haploplasma sp.]|nr:23S rRNA (guanosine(2251)-2'-O)-methyltransferase RlmB [Haploplasma sp.]